MSPGDLLEPAEREYIKQCHATAHQLQNVLQRVVGDGFPYSEHLTKANEQVEWLDRAMKTFEIA